MSFLKKLFSSKREVQIFLPKEFNKEHYETDSELKKRGLETVLGKMHNIVGHSIIPFSVGGAVDMYYFTNNIQGTGFATMELLNPDGNGPKPNRLGTYELVAQHKQFLIQMKHVKFQQMMKLFVLCLTNTRLTTLNSKLAIGFIIYFYVLRFLKVKCYLQEKMEVLDY